MLLLFFLGVVLVACGDTVTGPNRKDITSPPESSLLWDYRSDVERELITVHSVTDGVVYGTSYDQNVYALNSETGELLWQFKTEGEVGFPLVREGVLHVGDNLGNAYALDAFTGALLHSDGLPGRIDYRTGSVDDSLHVSAVEAGVAIWTTVLPQTPGGWLFWVWDFEENIYVSDLHIVHALDRETGKLLWSFRGEDQPLPYTLTSADGKVCMMMGYAATALDEETGALLWSFEPDYSAVRHYDRPPTIVDGVWFLAAGDLHALDMDTGRVLWKFEANGAIDPVTVWEDEDMVFVGSHWTSKLHAIDAATGSSVWGLDGEWVASSSAVENGVLYVHSLDGHIHTFDARNGDYIWSLDIGYHHWTAPFVISEDVLYVGYYGGVYAYKVPQR